MALAFTVIIFSLVSFLHNLEQKNIFCDKVDDINKFYSRFNKIRIYRDINKRILFKVHIGEGQFGQVLLAEKNIDNKKFAVKLVQNNTQSLEEYKVNWWEIDNPNII